MEKKIITSYINPDLDGIACMLAYAELLAAQGIEAIPAISGQPQKEVDFVCSEFNLELPKRLNKVLSDDSEIILVDTSTTLVLDKKIDLTKVIEIIDHHATATLAHFPNAKAQVELVGAAATLIAERFKKEEIKLSETFAFALILAKDVLVFHVPLINQSK